MSQAIIDKIRKGRKSKVLSGDFTFHVRRPTDMEWSSRGQLPISSMICKYTIGWDGVKESDLVHGGTADIIEFSHDLFVEWISDHPEHWEPIWGEIFRKYTDHDKEVTEAIKKLLPGSGKSLLPKS